MNVRGVVLVSIAVLIQLEVIGASAERDTHCPQMNTPALVSLCVPIHLWPTNVPVVIVYLVRKFDLLTVVLLTTFSTQWSSSQPLVHSGPPHNL